MTSRNILLALVVSLASGGSAWAQSSVDSAHIMSGVCGWGGNGFSCGSGGAPAHALTGDKDLDRAITICDAHPNQSTNTIPVWPEYDPSYPSCGPVMEKWSASAAAQLIAKHKAKEAADKAWLEDYVKGLKP